MVSSRLELLHSVRDLRELRGLEIGALTNPIITPRDLNGGGEIFYLDHLSTQDLKEKYLEDKSVEVEKIVNVDFICTDGNLKKAVGEMNFDYVIASHVIEHSPNLLQFLCDIYSILKPDGHVYLFIPDKRFTFDVNRPETTFGKVLEDFLSNHRIPSLSAVYDHFAMATQASGHNIWHGVQNHHDNHLLVSENFAWEAAHAVSSESKYFDVHVNIFTPASFFEILKKAIYHEIILFQVGHFMDTKVGEIDFFVCLKKPVQDEGREVKMECLDLIPKLKIENLLSPYMPQIRLLSESLKSSTELSSKLQSELKTLNEQDAKNNQIINGLQLRLDLTEKVLERKVVRWTLFLVDKLFSIFRRGKNFQN